MSRSWVQLTDYSGVMERSSFAEQRDDDLIPLALAGGLRPAASKSRVRLCHPTICAESGAERPTLNFLGQPRELKPCPSPASLDNSTPHAAGPPIMSLHLPSRRVLGTSEPFHAPNAPQLAHLTRAF